MSDDPGHAVHTLGALGVGVMVFMLLFRIVAVFMLLSGSVAVFMLFYM